MGKNGFKNIQIINSIVIDSYFCLAKRASLHSLIVYMYL